MKKIIVLATLVLVLTVSTGYAAFWQADNAATKETATPETAAPSPEAVTMVTQAIATPAVAITPELIAKKKAELNGTTWNISLNPMGGKGKAEADVITFADDKVTSANLEKQGFAGSNFTVRMQDDGTVTWETMQISEKEGMAFWRGDLNQGIMRGVLSKRDKRDNTKDFNFVSVTK